MNGYQYFEWAMGNIEKRLAFVQKWNRFDQPSLAKETRRLINHYGIRTGYLPPDFKLKAQDAHKIFQAHIKRKQQLDANPPGTEAATSTAA